MPHRLLVLLCDSLSRHVQDLHRESIDHITIPSKKGKGDLKRVSQVFDCWFESGSMPYASRHYPFEKKERFEQTFPADFIAEGLDQTRGWFYTLTVLGTALFGKSPFKNLIVNGSSRSPNSQPSHSKSSHKMHPRTCPRRRRKQNVEIEEELSRPNISDQRIWIRRTPLLFDELSRRPRTRTCFHQERRSAKHQGSFPAMAERPPLLHCEC